MSDHLLLAAALCRRYARNLTTCGPMDPFDVATECAELLEDAAQLVPTITENRVYACPDIWSKIS